jgi:hypothetical protein
MTSKTYIGFLNTTLKGLRILTRDAVSHLVVESLLQTIITAIKEQNTSLYNTSQFTSTSEQKNAIISELKQYCKTHYDINLNN